MKKTKFSKHHGVDGKKLLWLVGNKYTKQENILNTPCLDTYYNGAPKTVAQNWREKLRKTLGKKFFKWRFLVAKTENSSENNHKTIDYNFFLTVSCILTISRMPIPGVLSVARLSSDATKSGRKKEPTHTSRPQHYKRKLLL